MRVLTGSDASGDGVQPVMTATPWGSWGRGRGWRCSVPWGDMSGERDDEVRGGGGGGGGRRGLRATTLSTDDSV